MSENMSDIMPAEYQDPPQNAQRPTTDNAYTDILNEAKVANVIQQINPDTILEDIEQRLKGKRKDTLTKQWVDMPGSSKRISDDLVNNFVSFLGSILNQNTTFSNFQPEEINAIMELIIEYVTDDLDVNADIYGLQDNYMERTRIGMIVCQTVFTVLKRAQSGKEAKLIFSALNLKGDLTPESNSSGMMEALKVWK